MSIQNYHVYALFDRLDDALAAQAELEREGCSGDRCSAILHERYIDGDRLTTREGASSESAAKGAAAGGAVGVLLGGIAALGGGLVAIGPLAAAALAGGVLAGYGALVGGISGSDEPEQHLRALASEVEGGKILLALESDDDTQRLVYKAIVERHGGRERSS